MSKRDVNISEANLPLAPTIAEFVAGLRKWHDRQQRREGQTHDPIHGAAFARDAPKRKRGTVGTEVSGVQCALAFAKVCEVAGATYEDLDDWSISWGQWVVAPIHLSMWKK